METRHDELRNELVAILGAGRELTADTDSQLAEAFVHFLEQHQESEARKLALTETPHQPHYSLKFAGGAWGATLMFLCLLLVLDRPNPIAFVLTSVVLLTLVAVMTRLFLYLARYGWRVPHIRVTVAAPKGNPQNR